MAFPKGPPKPSSGLFFWLVIAVVSSLLLLLWGWQAGMLGKAGSFLSGLISPAQYAGYGKQTANNDGTGRPALRAEEEAARHRADAERKAREEAADTDAQTADKEAADKEAADKAAAEKAAADKAEAERLAAEKAQAEKEEAERLAAAEAEKKAAEEEAARKAEVEAQKKAAAEQLAAADQAGAQAGKRRVQVAPADVGEAAVNKELARNWPLAQLRKYFNLQEQARRLVITVDNLPREHVPSQLRVTRGVPELLRVKKEGETITLDPSNYERYDRIIGYVEKMDARKIGRLYAKFYPLLQRTYEETGFPEVLAALDDMMDAPRPTGPIRLVQPKVLYRFEDDHLENLSAGQKIMIRVGPDNAARLRKVLARVRAAIAAHDPDEQE